MTGLFLLILLVVLIVLALLSLRVAQEYQRALVFRLGRAVGLRGPGVFFLLPLLERAVFVDLRVTTRQLETQETVTRDGVVVKVNAVLWCRVENPERSVLTVVDWREAVQQAAETTLRDTIGQSELDGLLKDRVRTNLMLKTALVAAVSPWGVEITAVELKDLDIPESMQRALAREAEAVREKRARVIKAEGEYEASARLNDAAMIIARNPVALELRRLQTLSEIGAEHNSTIIISTPNDAAVVTAAAVSRAMGPP